MIHKYFLNGFYIILDVNSGAVHVVDACTYDTAAFVCRPMSPQCPHEAILALGEMYPPEDIQEAYSELLELYNNDLFLSEDSYESFAAKLGAAPVKSMCLNIAHDCNLRCEYCFAAQGDFGNGRKLMSFEVGKSAIDFMIEHSLNRRNLEVDFFGGEPLMNFKTVTQVVEYARSIEKKKNKNFRFTITTNGLLLSADRIEFINREMSNVVLSIDGRPEINDTLRRKADGTGSYDSIMPKYKKLLAGRKDKDYYVRGTYTKYNLDFSADVMHLVNLGFDQISVEPVITDESQPFAITADSLPRVLSEYDILSKEILKRKKRGERLNFFHFMLDLDQGPCAIKRLRGCSCGNEYIAVTPEGDIYPCHQFIGTDEWKMGSVLDGSMNLDMKNSFSKASVYAKDACINCWAKFYCSGGCNANNHQFTGSILKPHDLSCAIEKKRLECAIMIKAALAE